jgi:hypothetical protein
VDDLLPDDLTTDALRELARLSREAARRFSNRRYLEAMASLSAMDPLRAMLVEQCSGRWYGSGVDDDDASTLHDADVRHASHGYV